MPNQYDSITVKCDGTGWSVTSLNLYPIQSKTWTPTYTNDTNCTITANTATYSRDGNHMVGNLRLSLSGNGTDPGAVEVHLPSNHNIDFTNLTTGDVVGHGLWLDQGGGQFVPFGVRINSGDTTALYFAEDGASANIVGTDLDDTDYWRCTFRIPITEWKVHA